MKRLGIPLLLMFAAAVSTAQALSDPSPAPNPIIVPPGTRITLAFEKSVSSGAAKNGAEVHLQATKPVSVNGKVVIPKGTTFQGTVQRVQLTGKEALQLRLNWMMFPNAYTVDFTQPTAGQNQSTAQPPQAFVRVGRTRRKSLLVNGAEGAGGGAAIAGGISLLALGTPTGIGLGAGAGLGIGLLFGAINPATELYVKRGSRVEVELQQPITLDPERMPKGTRP